MQDIFKSLAEHSPELVGLCDPEFSPLYVNPAGRRLLGLDSLAPAGAVRLQDFFFPEDQHFVTEEFLRQVRREGSGEVEIRFRHLKTGTAIWAVCTVFQLRDPDGRMSGYALVSRDITTRKQAEDQLRASENKYRELFQSLLEAYCVIEVLFDDQGHAVDFRYLETNPAFERHATRPLLGRRIKEVVPDFEQFWIDQYGKVAVTGEPVTLEHAVAGLGHQWFRTAAFRVGGPDSRKVAVLFENITARKTAEDALQQSEAKLRAVIEEAPLAMALTGPTGEILFRNPRFDQLWGRPPHVTTAASYSQVYEGYHLDGRKIQSEEWPGARSVLKGEVVEDEVYEICRPMGGASRVGSAPCRCAPPPARSPGRWWSSATFPRSAASSRRCARTSSGRATCCSWRMRCGR